MNNHDFVKQFFDEKEKRVDRYGGRRRVGNLISDKGSLYSYGVHFPLAVETEDGDYVLNGDSYSVTTSHHQSIVRQAVPQGIKRVIIPFTVLSEAKIEPEKIKIVDIRDDEFQAVDDETGRRLNLSELSVLGHNHFHYDHQLGGSLIEYQGRYFISGIDPSAHWRHGYFLTELVRPVQTFQEGLDSLMPEKVQNNGHVEVKRQGEYFFIPFGTLTDIRKQLVLGDPNLSLFPKVQHRFIALPIEKGQYLPVTDPNRRPHHKVRDMIRLSDGRILVRGTVRHENGDHRMLNLKEQFHEVVHNEQVNSWSAMGRVD